MVVYADIWVYPDRFEVRQRGQVVETVPVERDPGEAWHHLVMARVAPEVESRGWQHNAWHRPRGNPDLLASTFAWREVP